MPSAAENHEINRIGNMPTFSISEYNKSLLLNCRAKKMYEKVSKQVKIFNISIYRHLQKCLYKGLYPKLSTNYKCYYYEVTNR